MKIWEGECGRTSKICLCKSATAKEEDLLYSFVQNYSCALHRFTFASEKHIHHVADTKLPTSAFNTLQILDFDQSILFVCNAAHAIQSTRLLSQIDNRFFHYRPMWFGSITNKLFLIFQGANNVCFFFRHDRLRSMANVKVSTYWRKIKE